MLLCNIGLDGFCGFFKLLKHLKIWVIFQTFSSVKPTNDPFSLGPCLVFGFLLDGQGTAATERVVDCFRCWGCGLLHQLLTLFHAKQGAKVGSVASPLHEESQSNQGSTTPYGAGSTQPGTSTAGSLISSIKHFYPSRGSCLLQRLSCDEITTGQMAFFIVLAGFQPVLSTAVLHEVLPCLPVHQHDRKDRLVLG